jgi:hypothetical protein
VATVAAESMVTSQVVFSHVQRFRSLCNRPVRAFRAAKIPKSLTQLYKSVTVYVNSLGALARRHPGGSLLAFDS